MSHRIAVLGSAFNPPHMGHANVVEQALTLFDRVILVPSFAHAFGKKMAPFTLRLAMVEALRVYAGWGARVEVSDIEQKIAAQKPFGVPIYTFDVLEAIEVIEPRSTLTFVVGPDNAAAATWAKFYKSEDIDLRWGRWVAKEQKSIRSTAIRAIIEQGQYPPESACPAVVVQPYFNFVNTIGTCGAS
ncbi:adenylyltransferase/cytidyltransferase family protein [Marinagarivorans algicola]|uniref:adenylyltransferase/cytidyltransferase family protein n=1 Tax=Marinagarivorans algicola TaxID=1513270 RepID=UPI0006B5D7B1|nr:adenylyltransferase/cytidyltransferase family protein [Marinagarivorans algicola]